MTVPLASIIYYYVLGGLTFVPLVLILCFLHAYLTLPYAIEGSTTRPSGVSDSAADSSELEEKFRRSHEPDVAAGYFAVCREYVPGGVNGKPPERTTPAGETIAAESPSVYQSMYRSIFERGKSQVPSIEAGKPVKKARNVFFVVLRHGHLVLFDDDNQLEVRHVISLEQYDVDIFDGTENPVPEGELWIKRNCMRLRKAVSKGDDGDSCIPFYLFSDNCSEKEDFYHALINNQRSQFGRTKGTAEPLVFETEDMIKLIRVLHLSEETPQTRWFNALIGRVFLSLYKTPQIEALVRNKISKKIARVAKPAFIPSINLETVDLGDSGPIFANPKLREMTVDGCLVLETDVKYNGGFKAVASAIARIDLGSRFKAREVHMVLAGVLKKLEGHVLLKIKPPPSNRIWFTFETMPKLDISLEPIVSSRQITYGIVLRALVSRIREVFGETLVQPNWDDIPFSSSLDSSVRGGIWKKELPDDESVALQSSTSNMATSNIRSEPNREVEGLSNPEEKIKKGSEKTSDFSFHPTELSSSPSLSTSPAPVTSNLSENASSISSPSLQVQSIPAEKPKAMRSNSFATAARPIISKSPATTESLRGQSRRQKRNATSAIETLSQWSPESSPMNTPSRPTSRSSTQEKEVSEVLGALPSDSDTMTAVKAPNLKDDTAAESEPHVSDDNSSLSQEPGLENTSNRNKAAETMRGPKGVNTDRAKTFNQSLTNATLAAKNWGWNVINKANDRDKAPQPMGRGRPLPPPGVPLPNPPKPLWSGNTFNSLRRKPVPPPRFDNNQPISKEPDPAESTNSSAISLAEDTASETLAHASSISTEHSGIEDWSINASNVSLDQGQDVSGVANTSSASLGNTGPVINPDAIDEILTVGPPEDLRPSKSTPRLSDPSNFNETRPSASPNPNSNAPDAAEPAVDTSTLDVNELSTIAA